MVVLGVAVALVGVLCLLNLILTFGVIRRLREHTTQMADLRGLQGSAASVAMPAGSQVPDFATTTTEGEPVTAEDLNPATLIGFFSPSCGPCKERMPEFIEYARTFPGGRDRVIAVIQDEEGSAEHVAAMTPVARVVLEAHAGPMGTAFQINGYPALCLVRERVVEVSDSALGPFPTAVSV